MNGVVSVTPKIDGQVMGTANGVSTGVQVRGIRADDLQAMTMVSKTLSDGALEHFHGDDAVIIGARLADQLRVAPGYRITLIAPHGNVTPFGMTPRIKTYMVAGTFRVGMSQFDQSVVFMPLDEAQLFFDKDKAVTGLEVMITDPDRANAMVAPIERAAGPYSRIGTWQDMHSTFLNAVEVERNVMFLILTLSFSSQPSISSLACTCWSATRGPILRSCAPWAPRAAPSCASS